MKLSKLIIFGILSLLISGAVFSGEPKRVKKTSSLLNTSQADISKYKLQIIEAEKNSKTIVEYKTKRKIIIDSFKKHMRSKLSKLRATEVIQCKVYARRPDPFKGRNSDSCKIKNDSSYFQGWDVISANDKRIDDFNGGKPKGGSTNKNNIVTLSLSCQSPKWDDLSSGRCQLTMQTTITYKSSNKLIEESINKEVGILLSI
ncbi:MAG: hypothetical protein CR991_04025 [Proteobacteria bacterium]|nr:MAG: hypothetical protein CR991_04025 [Pseudomonadota bacterium]